MILFNDLRPSQKMLATEIETAIRRVVSSGRFVLGPEVEAFENAFAAYHSVRHAVGVANGTDAIELALRAAGIGPGDEVITVAHTAVATVCAIERAGATPILVDIDSSTYTIDPDAVLSAIGPRTKALVVVHLYGHPASMSALSSIAAKHNLFLLEDCAQAHGARFGNQLVGTIGDAGAFSFYPTKNLGACGDGGAVITNDDNLAQAIRRLRNYGQVSPNVVRERGINSRLDEMQAAILSIKLSHLDEYNAARRSMAAAYRQSLTGIDLPCEGTAAEPIFHVYHLFVVRHSMRDKLRSGLTAQGIETMIHYPTAIHLQPAYTYLGLGANSLPVTERIALQILSLPMYIGLGQDDIERVVQAVTAIAQRI